MFYVQEECVFYVNEVGTSGFSKLIKTVIDFSYLKCQSRFIVGLVYTHSDFHVN